MPLAPRVIGYSHGILRTALVPGRPRRLHRLDAERAAALGRALAQVHGRRTAASGGLPGWRSRATSLVAYARGRGRDAMARAGSAADRALVEHAARAAEAGARTAGHARFAFLHGDLVEQNILWPPNGGPVLVDWEFWRMGDPAEDLAYVTSVNDEDPGDVTGAIYRGYGADWPLMARVDLWRPLVLLDAAFWHRAHGDPSAAPALLERAEHYLHS